MLAKATPIEFASKEPVTQSVRSTPLSSDVAQVSFSSEPVVAESIAAPKAVVVPEPESITLVLGGLLLLPLWVKRFRNARKTAN